jgi:hypothetical protein
MRRPERRVFVKLPPEDWQDGGDQRCGLLNVSLYGTRDAAADWEVELAGFLVGHGLTKGIASPCFFRGKSGGITVAVCGDDITVEGTYDEVRRLIAAISAKYEVKVQFLGQDKRLMTEGKILNATLSWTPQGIWWEADARHVKEVIEGLGLARANPVSSPGVVEPIECGKVSIGCARDKKNQAEELGRGEASRYRSVAARLNYFCQDRPDVRFSVMTACGAMSKPTVNDVAKLKRIGRYLLKRPRVACLYQWQKAPGRVTAYSDSDWAGDRVSRKSTSSGCLMIGQHTISTWSKCQTVVATSSAEAEPYALTRAACQSKGLQSLCTDLGIQNKVVLYADSTAAIAIASRTGLGKAKHIAIQDLWIQGEVKADRVEILKVGTDHNLADLMTKNLPEEKINYFMANM